MKIFDKKKELTPVLTPSDTGVSALVRKMGAFTGWAAEKGIQFLVEGTKAFLVQVLSALKIVRGYPRDIL